MYQDPTSAPVTARVILTGVMLMCINDENQYELGFIKCPKHEPTLKVDIFRLNALTGNSEPTGTSMTSPITSDLYIKVMKPDTPGTAFHQAKGKGKNRDYKLIPDLEGADFHGGPLKIKTGLLNGRVGITAGLLYTHKESPASYDLVSWSEANARGRRLRPFGKMASQGGINILCKDEKGSGIAVIDNDTGKRVMWLPRLPDTYYQISIENDCGMGEGSANGATDFRFYYNVIDTGGAGGKRTGKEKRFDFRPVGNMAAGPEVCNLALLSQTKSLGLKKRLS